jgi:hypothetical protein
MKLAIAFLMWFTLPLGQLASVQNQAVSDNSKTNSNTNKRETSSVDAVRTIVKSVNEGWASGQLKTSKRTFEGCGDAFTEFRRLTTDANGVVRRYEVGYTAEDEGRTDQYYYDESGRLRFVLISGSAGNGSKLRHRIYLDQNGKRLREQHTVTSGPGHFWPKTWPDKELHKADAARDFANNSRCTKEGKSRGLQKS